MLYPRTTETGDLIQENQMVGVMEHLMNDKRICFLTGIFQGAMDAHNYLLALDTFNHDPIKIIVTSGGGDLDSAFLLYDTIKLIQSPVYTLGRYCASAAALILAAGDKRYLMPHAKVMLHLPSSQNYGDTRDLEIQHTQAKLYRDKMVEIIQACGVKKSSQEILVEIDREFWLDPEEAIGFGLADEVITKETLAEWLK